VWSRCRAWLQYEGYSHEIAADSSVSFRADPAGRFAQWRFLVPAGMGRKVPFAFKLELAPGENAARLSVFREDSPSDGFNERVRIVFRPDLECRSFHEVTKAYCGECEIASRIAANVRLDVSNGEFHAEPQWTYCVPHPDEEERGQEPCGDLYSPGWIACDFMPGGSAAIVCRYANAKGFADDAVCMPDEGAVSSLPLKEALDRALDLYLVRRN
jgi:hypothetical protein